MYVCIEDSDTHTHCTFCVYVAETRLQLALHCFGVWEPRPQLIALWNP